MSLSPLIKSVVASRTGVVCVHEHCPDRPYVELVVPKDCCAARSIEYTTDSKDQGFCDGPKNSSYSWFEASVRRGYDRNNLRNIPVCWNRVGNPRFQKQTPKTWSPGHPHWVSLQPWLEALLPGDVIELSPKATYAGWLNIVREAQIKLVYEATEPLHQAHVDPVNTVVPRNPLYAMPLDSANHQLRVLAVQPGAYNESLKCRLLYAQRGNVEAKHRYDALSYVCGPPGNRIDIDVELPSACHDDHGSTLSITRSAESAIRRLREGDQEIKLWVDSACINEDNNLERAQQVRMMGTTFSQARFVHVWLGEEHAGIEAALRIIRDAYNLHRRVCPDAEACTCRGTRHTSLQKLDEVAKKLGGQVTRHRTLRTVFQYHLKGFNRSVREYAGGVGKVHVLKLLSHLLGHPYFARSWCIQEVIKSRIALVHCGAECIPWKELSTINSWLVSDEFRAKEPHVYSSQMSMPGIWVDLSPLPRTKIGNKSLNAKKAWRTQPHVVKILEVYLSSLDLKATDARDKIFAILSLATETMIEDKIPEPLLPDYEKCIAKVFANFTRWWVVEYRSLDILSAVHCHRERTWQRMTCSSNGHPPLPRPSWTVPVDGRGRWFKATLKTTFDFEATGKTNPDSELLRLWPNSNPLIVKLLGYRVLTIQAIEHLSTKNQHKTSDESLRELFKVYHALFDPSNVGRYWKTSTSSVHHSDFRIHQAGLRLENHTQSHSSTVSAVDPCSSKRIEGAYMTANTRGIPYCTDPCLFMAANGMMGLCPWTAKRGDLVALLLGGSVPYLLRPKADAGEFAFVGECFVAGIMHGEFLRQQTEKGVVPETFSLI